MNMEVLELAYNWQWKRSVGRPVVFQVELTNHCPMTCQMCPRTHAMSRPLGYMPVEMFERIVDQAAAGTSAVFLHHFGDSLLHPQLGECIKAAAARRVRTCLSANPNHLTRPRIEALVDNGLDELVLSLDGVTSQTSDAVRGRAARNVDLAERRVHELLEYRATAGRSTPYVIMQIVRQKQNQHEVDAWLAKWKAVPGVDRLKVKSYITWDGREDKINALRIEPVRPIQRSVVCRRPWTSVTVLWDGRVVPCCFDYDGSVTLGSLAEESLAEIWKGLRLGDLREAHRSADLSGVSLCQRCEDKEGYPVRSLTYPFNRLRHMTAPVGDEWSQES
jgi:MoaA/NifB/PqqE/SkfB family radical SAM enzyme